MLKNQHVLAALLLLGAGHASVAQPQPAPQPLAITNVNVVDVRDGRVTWLGKPREIGVVAAGARADLVFLDANPLDDIRNVRRIRAVARRGQLLDRKMLDRLLASALQNATAP